MMTLANEAGDYTPADSPDDDGGTADGEALCLEVPFADAGERLDAVLARLIPEHSRSRLQAWIRAGRVEVDGQPRQEPKLKLRGGEALAVFPDEDPATLAFAPEAVDFPLVHEDAALAVVDKPAGLVVHPGSGNWSGTLLNGLLHRWPDAAALPRAGIVHRLDKETSGLMVVARSLTVQTDLIRQLQARTVKREYLALAVGQLRGDATIDAPIGRHPTQRTRMAVVDSGKPAVTRVRVIEYLPGCTVIQCSLETGRTHQIRVHLAEAGHPLVGDPVYGDRRARGFSFFRQALHARRLGLVHPQTRQPMTWESPVPADLAELIERLRHG